MEHSFKVYDQNSCIFCGSHNKLSGEHKVKASMLRSEFGTDKMLIGRLGEHLHVAQGPKSKALHFKSKICTDCNNKRTQPADREFDRFHAIVKNKLEQNIPFQTVFDQGDYKKNSIRYLNVHRYFAKILCCQIVDADGPIAIDLARYALGETSENIITLNIDSDWYYNQIYIQYGAQKHASHGGLVIYANKDTHRLTAFHSTLTIGAIRYTFNVRFSEIVEDELCMIAPDFCKRSKESILKDEVSEIDRLKLGLQQSSS